MNKKIIEKCKKIKVVITDVDGVLTDGGMFYSHEGDIMNGTVEWNLKSKENLDISYGVYFFVMESKTFKSQSGKFAIIK